MLYALSVDSEEDTEIISDEFSDKLIQAMMELSYALL